MWERVLCPGVRRARLWGPLQPLFLFGTGHHLQGVGMGVGGAVCAPTPDVQRIPFPWGLDRPGGGVRGLQSDPLTQHLG